MSSNAKVTSIWRYPVKSMMGEEMNACYMTEVGVLGDRAYALVDTSTGKLVNAKNPLKWPRMFEYRASFTVPPDQEQTLPPVRITFPDGSHALSNEEHLNQRLSESFGKPLQFMKASNKDIQFEGYIPDLEELDHKNTVFTRTSPKGTFFDIAMVHIVTTATLNRLRHLIPESQIEVRRFRPNLVLDVPDEVGFVENEWIGKEVRIGEEVRLQIIQPTKRCVMTTLAQGDLPKDQQILKGAVQHNQGCIGVYAAVLQTGTIRRGDRLAFE